MVYAKRRYESRHDFLYRQMGVVDLVGGDPRYAYIKAGLYFLFLPYLSGVVFLFFVSAGGSFSNLFLVIQEGGFFAWFMQWAIGYELLVSMFLGWCFYQFFSLKDLENVHHEQFSTYSRF